VYVERPVKEAFEKKLIALVEKAVVGDPTARETYLGPVINDTAAKDYQGYVDDLKSSGKILFGAKRLTDGPLGKGSFCAPTVATDVPFTHRLWKHEMFLPITMVGAVDSLDEAMKQANDAEYGLTAGFYGSKKEAEWFFDHIEAGVCYANRPQGATTGAWPGHQPFGGWKGSGSTGKSAGSFYYVQQFMREQSRTIVE
jgi:1-pyrroline-5-carboxylate dehydrogenase